MCRIFRSCVSLLLAVLLAFSLLSFSSAAEIEDAGADEESAEEPALLDGQPDDSYGGSEFDDDIAYVQYDYSDGVAPLAAVTPITFRANSGYAGVNGTFYVGKLLHNTWLKDTFRTSDYFSLGSSSSSIGVTSAPDSSYSGIAFGFADSSFSSTFTYDIPESAKSISLQGSFSMLLNLLGYFHGGSSNFFDFDNSYNASVCYVYGYNDSYALLATVNSVNGRFVFDHEFSVEGYSKFILSVQFSNVPLYAPTNASSPTRFVGDGTLTTNIRAFWDVYSANYGFNMIVSDSSVDVDVDFSPVLDEIAYTNDLLSELIPLVQQTNSILSGTVLSALNTINSTLQSKLNTINSTLKSNFSSLISAVNTNFTSLISSMDSDFQTLGSLISSEFSSFNEHEQSRADLLNSNLKNYLTSSLTAYGFTSSGTFSVYGSGTDAANLLVGVISTLRGATFRIMSGLFGDYQDSYVGSFYTFDNALNRGASSVTYTNLLQAIVDIGARLQRPLSQLQAVLANDDDLRLRQDTQDQVDSVTDNFTGGGGAAPSLGDIGNMADVSSDFSGMFDSGVGAGDLMGAVNGADTYSFFSQEVSDSLDTTGRAGIAVASDELDDLFDLSGYKEGEDGVLVPVDGSFFSVDDYLGKED